MKFPLPIKNFLSFILLLQIFSAEAQDFSNKGKDFWLCFPSHVPNERFGTLYYAKMSLFITSEKATSGKVTVGNSFAAAFTVIPGQVSEIDVPYSTAHILPSEAGQVIQKGIHVTVDKDKPAVVVYAQIYAGFRSAASLILPVSVLGKSYYSMNAPQQGISGSKSQFVVMAVDSNTTVQIIPVRDGTKGAPFTIQLSLPGDLYEYQDDNDLTGSYIESIATGTDVCKQIAVFSGSSAISIDSKTPCEGYPSYDPLYQQLYPVNAWGKTYGFIPFAQYNNGNPFRILASENNTVVTINGSYAATLNAGEFFPDKTQFGTVETKPVFISADKPVSVAQYAQRSGCSGTIPPASDKGYGDPEMVMLNPVEQNINHITVFSSAKENIYNGSKFINVLITDAASSSFTINGSKPNAQWQQVQPSGSGYVAAQIKLHDGLSAFTLAADSSFNAMAYGFGDYESYAYSAGTNVKDLYRTVRIENEFGNADAPVGCRNASFRISVTFPYQPNSISFSFNGLLTDATLNNPVPVESLTVNDKTVYRYRLDQLFKIDSAGLFPFKITATQSQGNACTAGDDIIEFDMEVIERSHTGWNFVHSGCITDTPQFIDTSNDKRLQKFYWDFGDGLSAANVTASHLYTSSGQYNVAHWAANSIGCGTDTSVKVIEITEVPVAGFSVPFSICADQMVQVKEQSTIAGNSSIKKWYWDFGDQQTLELSQSQSLQHQYSAPGDYTVALLVESASGCKSQELKQSIKVHDSPKAAFTPPVVCLPDSATFISQSTISDGTESQFSYDWDFGDGTNSHDASPKHLYKTIGPFAIKLGVTSVYGCRSDTNISLLTIHPQVKIAVDVPNENCLGDSSTIGGFLWAGDESLLDSVFISINGNTYSKINLTTALEQWQQKILFNSAGDQLIHVFGIAATGCPTDTVMRTVKVNALPFADFSFLNPACEGTPVYFANNSTVSAGTITKWNWDFGNGKGSMQENPSQIFDAGIFDVRLVAETDKGCKRESLIKQIKIINRPIADFELPKICAGDPYAQFVNKSIAITGDSKLFNYQWRFNDALSTASNPDSSLQKDPTHLFAGSGRYKISLRAITPEGCSADTVKELIVNGSKPEAYFTIDHAGSLCSNEEVLVKDASVVDFGSIVKTEIYWDYGNDASVKTVDDHPAVGKTYSFRYPETFDRDLPHKIKYVVYSGAQCLNQLDTNIIVGAVPKIRFDSLSDACTGSAPYSITSARLTADLNGHGVFSGKGVSEKGFFNPLAAGIGNHQITYTFKTERGCISSAAQTIRVFASPGVDAGPDRYISKGERQTLQGAGSGRGLQFSWAPVVAIDNPSIPNAVVYPKQDMTYVLTATTSDGCSASDEVTIHMLKEILVPNAFTPNNDGKNDQWNIPYLKYFEGCSVQVFNRYGQRVFYSQGYSTPWDGRQNGRELPSGVYCWVIDLKKGGTPLYGNVTIIR